MKRLFVIGVVLIAALTLNLPAQATPEIHYGKKCQVYTWGGALHDICMLVNRHDFNEWQEGLIQLSPGPHRQAVLVYIYEIRLYMNGSVVETSTFEKWFAAVDSQSTDWEKGCWDDTFYAWAKFKLEAGNGKVSPIEYLTSNTVTLC